jgi:hypothetical protein
VNRALAALAVLLFAASAAIAQSTPPPPQPYPPPITSYDGRYLDSAQTPDIQFPNRTLRTYKAKNAPELNLMLVALSGSTFAAYDLSTFTSRLATEPLSTFANGEKYLPPDIVFDAQSPGSGFVIVPQDGQNFLRDFDYDDRGDFYLAYGPWGFGLIDHSAHLLSQVATPPVLPNVILSVKLGSSYFALISDATTATAVYDVTNPAAPVFVRMFSVPIAAYAKSASNIAIVNGSGLSIYTPSALVTGAAPLQQIAGSFIDVTTDGSRFFALRAPSTVATLTPQQNGSYTEIDTPLNTSGFGVSITYGAGYLGIPLIAPKGLVLFADTGSGLTRYDLSPYVAATYSGGRMLPHYAVPFHAGASTHLLLAFDAIGDVFQLAAVTAVPAISPLALALIALALAGIAALKLR